MTTRNETITCPKCGHQFAVADAMSEQIRNSLRAEMQKEIILYEKQLAERKLAFERETGTKAVQKAQEEAALRMGDMQQALDESNKQVEELRRQDQVKDKVISDLMSALEDMKRRYEQGLMDSQGEVFEQDMEAHLRRIFAQDEFRAIKKDEHGTDLVQTILNEAGRDCGTILWEMTSDKVWSRDWTQKLKDDMYREAAAIGILSSLATREGIVQFGHADGVWISEPAYAVAIAAAMRQQLIAVDHELHAATGNREKVKMPACHIADPEFRQRIESMVNTFTVMSRQLIVEKAVLERQLAQRKKQILRVVKNSTGLYADFCGMIGSAVPKKRRGNKEGAASRKSKAARHDGPGACRGTAPAGRRCAKE